MFWVNNGLKIKKRYIASVMMVRWHLGFATTETKTEIAVGIQKKSKR